MAYFGGIKIIEKKLVIFITVLCLLLVSIGSATAMEDNSENFIVPVDLDDGVVEQPSTDVMGVDDVKTSITVKNSTFNDYFESDGTLKSEVTSDELIFEGNFSNLGISTITINKKISIAGNQATINNIQFILAEKGIEFSKMTLIATNWEDALIYVVVDDISLNNNTLIVNGKDGESCYGIYMDNVNNISLTKNLIDFESKGAATTDNFALYVNTVDGLTVKDNIIDSKLPSLDVGYDASWQSTPYSATMYIADSENVLIRNNSIKTKFNAVSGSYDTLYGIFVKSVNDFILSSNVIETEGKKYVYAVRVGGSLDGYISVPCEDFNISDNIISSKGDYGAYGIELGGQANGIVCNNNITVSANNVTYGIYSYAMNGPITADYINNTVNALSNSVYGFELCGSTEKAYNNVIIANGNFTIGIASKTNRNMVIENNKIFANGQGKGVPTEGDSFKSQNVGILLTNNAKGVIQNNIIKVSNGSYAINASKTTKSIEISNNILEKGIYISGDNVNVLNNTINYNAIKGKDSIVINAVESSNLIISDNNITYIGDTDGTSKNAVILMDEVDNVVISGNKITGSLSSVPVNWIEVDGNWVSDAASLVISAKGSNIDIINNNINTTCGDVSGYYDTIYGIQIAADNVNIKNNDLAFEGSEYLYGMSISGKNITIDNNNITSAVKSSHAYAMELTTMGGGEFSGIVSNNNIKVTAPKMAYGITSFGNVNATYDANVIDVNANTTIGLEAQGVDENITNNKITSQGNYVIGIGSGSTGKLTISNNDVSVTGNGQGNKDSGDSMIVGNVGIYIKNNVENATVSNNNITANIPSRSWTIQSAGLIAQGPNTSINNNKIDVTAINQDGAYDSVYGMKITGDDSKVTNNAINVNGLNYTYGMTVGGEDVLVDGNNVTVICSGYYAGAINVNSPFKGNVSNNNIKVSSKDVAYGIFDWGDVNSTYANNVIEAESNSVYAIEACGNVQEVINNTINAKGNYTLGIAGSASGSLNIKDNKINIDGKGLGNATGGDAIQSINAGIYLTKYVNSANIANNVINANIATVPYGENGAALITESANTKINNNKINATVSNSASDYNSFYGVKTSGDNTTLTNNNITVEGEGYAYAVVVSGEDITIDSNNIDVTNDNNYACGLNINDPFIGEVSNNNITVSGKDSAYGIYTSQWGGSTIEGNYTNNNVDVTGKTAYAMELMGEKETVDNNTITVNGEYTMGIATSTKDIAITNNTIVSNGTGKDSTFTYDMFGATNEGILIYDDKTKAEITGNDIKSTGDFAVNVLKSKNNQTTVTDNVLIASMNKGSNAINNVNGVISNNTPVPKFVLISDDIVMYFKNGTRWYATLTDGNDTIKGANITFALNGEIYDRTTNANGTTSIALNLNPGTYAGVVSYTKGNDSVVKTVTVTILSTISSEDMELYFKNGSKFNANFTDGKGNVLNGTAKFNINGVIYDRKVTNGTTSGVSINLNPGVYTITAINELNGEMKSFNITILSTIIANNLTMYYMNGSTFNAVFLDGQGNPLNGSETKARFNINGVFYDRAVNENGTTSGLALKLNPGEYVITVIAPNGEMKAFTIIILADIIAEDFTTPYKAGLKYRATALDGQGKPQAGVNLTFNINGIMYYRTTNESGVSGGITINLIPGEYIMTVMREDTGAMVSKKVTITPAA